MVEGNNEAVRTLLSAGTKLTRSLTITHVLHDGSTSVVYRGVRWSGGRRQDVAIKVLHDSLTRDASAVGRFLREGKLGGRMGWGHANLVPSEPIDQTKVRGCLFFYFVMPYIPGVDLDTLVHDARKRGKTLPRPITGAIFLNVLRGLSAAHLQGIIHGDLSPGQVRVGADGTARNIDWGVAVEDGQVADGCKPRYAAPEAILGKALSFKSDQFMIGVTLWEVLNGRALFRVDSIEQRRALLGTPLPKSPDLPAPLAEVMDRMLQEDPERRFPTTQEAEAALLRALVDAKWITGARDVADYVREFQERTLPEASTVMFGSATPPSAPAPTAPDPAGLMQRLSSAVAGLRPSSVGAVIPALALGGVAAGASLFLHAAANERVAPVPSAAVVVLPKPAAAQSLDRPADLWPASRVVPAGGDHDGLSITDPAPNSHAPRRVSQLPPAKKSAPTSPASTELADGIVNPWAR